MEPYFELFDLLESNNAQSVEEAKKQLHNYFNTVKDSWLVHGMFDYYMTTNSIRIVEIFVCMREPHEIFLFEKLSESLKSTQKSQALSLLGHIVSRNPTWMYKIVKQPLMKDLFKVLKNETDIIPLMSALLTLIILLPIVAGYLGPHLQDVFDIFSRLAAWNTNNPNRVPEGQLLHLQLGLHALFNRLYGMYPWSFLNHLRQLYTMKDTFPIFNHTIVPMLDTVKMHPLLVTTASKEKEVTHPRWKKMEVNDVILECAKLTVDCTDKPSSRDDCGSFRARTASLRSTSSLDYSASAFGGGGVDGRSSVGIASFSANLSESGDVWSPTVFCSGNTPPGSAPTSIPHTPISQTYVSSSNLPQQEGTSPPEAAVEATPESTPVKDLRQRGRDRPSVPIGPIIVNFNSSLMGGSQPSSPLRKDSSIFRYPSSSPLSAEAKNPYHISEVRKLELERAQDLRNVVSPQKMLIENLGEQLQNIADSCEQEDREVEATLSHEMNTSTPSHCGVGENSGGVISGRTLVDCSTRSSRCQEGGLHMPDSQSMIQFTKRLRYYSQCLTDPFPPNILQGMSSGSSPGEGGRFSELQVRRAISCPEMKKPSGTSISADISCLALDETAEDEELVTNLNGHSTQIEGNCTEEKKFVDRVIQTDDMPPPLGYEHLFFALYPSSDQPSIHSAPPNVTCPPVFPTEINQNKFTPSTALENYIEAAAKASSLRHNELSDLKTCKEHIFLFMLQLQFERHRREVHAERNRRLLGKSRANSALEEHNNALKDQVGLLQKDIETLRSELEKVKQEAKFKMDKIHQGVTHWQDKSCLFEKQSKDHADKVSLLEQELRDQKSRFEVKSKEYNECKALMFELENSLRCVSEKAKEGHNVREDMARLQFRLTASCENELKLRSVIDKILLNSKKAEESLLATQNFHHHTQSLEQQLEAKTVQLDAVKAKINDLECALSKKDSEISQQENLIQSIKDEYVAKIKGLENKCNDLRRMNSKLEDSNLELLHRVEMLELSGKKVHNQSSPPLSTSLSSSGNLSLSGGESTPLTNLHLLVDQSEPSSFRDPPSPT